MHSIISDAKRPPLAAVPASARLQHGEGPRDDHRIPGLEEAAQGGPDPEHLGATAHPP